ncbi:hypothetical protein C8J56DRAFT_935127 [Mycena floridula]|nr:hypothetical protein C8J56DRAFT_935127 [Mycena floridula]
MTEKLDDIPQVEIRSAKRATVREMFIFMKEETPITLVALLVLTLGFGPAYYAFDRITQKSKDFYDPALRTLAVALTSASTLSSAAAIGRKSNSTATHRFSLYMTLSYIAFATIILPPKFRFSDRNHSWNDVAALTISAISTGNFIGLLWIGSGGRNGNLISNSSCIVMGLWWLVLLGLSQYGIELNVLF